MEREPNSRHFWRINSIQALRLTKRSESEARDPEDLEAIKADNLELMQLETREKAVSNRAARMHRPKPAR
jgi:hypothetical protein